MAAGDLHARQEPSGADDDIDAVIVGVNMLAEELEASNAELEARVAARTREVEQLNKEFGTLVAMIGFVVLLLGAFEVLLKLPAFAGLATTPATATSSDSAGSRWWTASSCACSTCY